MMPRRLRVSDVNAHVMCTICEGYLVDATAITECLHAFCRTCIVRYLESSKYCPVCDVQVHKTKPLNSIRSDQTLQDVVYKVVPGLYQNEMQRRRDFYAEHPEAGGGVAGDDAEERGEGEPRFFSPKEAVSLCLQIRPKEEAKPSDMKDPTTRHLKCPAAFTVAHLKKFVHLKFSLPNTFAVDIFYDDHLLKDSFTLMDVAYIYSWKRAEPMKFFYTVTKRVARCAPEPLPTPPEQQQHQKEQQASVPPPVSEPEPMEVDPKPPPEEPPPPQAPVLPVKPPAPPPPEETAMEVEPPPPPKPHSSLPLPEPTYNSVKVVSVPESGALLSPTNGFRLKFIHDPDKLKVKEAASASKKSGRKGGSRHKSAPVRLARLAPYPPPPPPVTCLPQPLVVNHQPPPVGKLAPAFITTLVATTSNDTPCTAGGAPRPPFPGPAAFCKIVSTGNLPSLVVNGGELPTPSGGQDPHPTPSSTVAQELPGFTRQQTTTDVATKSPHTVTASQTPSDSLRTTAEAETPPPVRVQTPVSKDPTPQSVGDFQSATPSDGDPTPATQESTTEPPPGGGDVARTSSDPPPPPPCPVPSVVAAEEPRATTTTQSVGEQRATTQDEKGTTLSADYSDDDDLGCQPDLVVDERKLEEDTGSEDNEDAALRKKIDAIARQDKDDDDVVTDDTEADSGRASDMSCPARSCEEDCAGSPATTTTAAATATTETVAAPAVSSSSEDAGPRTHPKTNSIDHVIKQLYLQHEIGRNAAASPKSATQRPVPQGTAATKASDDSGVLDLSTGCARKPGEGGRAAATRPRPVANPVLDLKHRQQTYMPAPIKQHTACPPAPKHPTSSLLMHQLTATSQHPGGGSILQAQLTGGVAKQQQHALHHHHLHHHALPYSIPVGRTFVSSSSTTPTSTTPSLAPPSCAYKFSPSAAHQAFPASMLPYSMMNAYGGIAIPARSPKDASCGGGKMTFGCHSPKQQQSSSKRLSDAASSSSGRPSPVATGGGAPAHPRASPSMLRATLSPHHRSASPAPSPQAVATSPIHGLSTPLLKVHKGASAAPKGGGSKFKKGPNLAVFNPDPNGFRQKLVIKNLDSKSSSSSNHHHNSNNH